MTDDRDDGRKVDDDMDWAERSVPHRSDDPIRRLTEREKKKYSKDREDKKDDREA